jgi:hypothetical protein
LFDLPSATPKNDASGLSDLRVKPRRSERGRYQKVLILNRSSYLCIKSFKKEINVFIPKHFSETRVEDIHRLIRSHPLGILVNALEGMLDANYIPFELDPSVGYFQRG